MKSICQSRNKYLQDIKNFNYFRISFHPQKWLGVTKKYSHSSHKGWWSLSVLCCCVTNYHRPRNLKQPRVIVLVTQWWRICLPVQKMQVWSLGREDPLKKEMTTDSCFLAWEIPWTGEPGRLQSMGSKKSRTRRSEWAHIHMGPVRTKRVWKESRWWLLKNSNWVSLVAEW